MLLCLDVGNSHIYGGIFEDETLRLRFRHNSKQDATSDQLGVFLRSVIRDNNLSPESINQIAICSVVPPLDYSLRSACIKYFNIDPFTLQPIAAKDLTLCYSNPQEIGADRIANAIAATNDYPHENLIIVDFGTATTICAINDKKHYLGGTILAGMSLSMNALQKNTAKLMPVEIVQPKTLLGRSTVESIQSGLYYSQLATIRLIIKQITNEEFHDKSPIIIGTGGFAHLFESEALFTAIMPDLVLHGLKIAAAHHGIRLLRKNSQGANITHA